MSQHSQLHRSLEASFDSALNEAGWTTERVTGHDDTVFLISSNRERFFVVLDVSQRPVLSSLEAVLSRAALVAQKFAEAHRARPLAVVGAENISRRMAESLRFFAQKFLDNHMAYGWIDGRGRLQLHGSKKLAALEGWQVPGYARISEPIARKPALFTDLGQWLFKVLLAPRISSSLLTAPRSKPDNARHLALLAGVSAPTAHRLVAAAKDEGFIRATRGFVSIVDTERLLDRWQKSIAGPRTELRAKWILAKRDSSSALKKVLSTRVSFDSNGSPTACLGLFAAAEYLGLGVVDGVPPHLLLRQVTVATLEGFGLRQAKEGENADVLVLQPAYPQSTFRGAVLHDGVFATDALQTWLDTSIHRARGAEQADAIERRVLTTMFDEGDA